MGINKCVVVNISRIIRVVRIGWHPWDGYDGYWITLTHVWQTSGRVSLISLKKSSAIARTEPNNIFKYIWSKWVWLLVSIHKSPYMDVDIASKASKIIDLSRQSALSPLHTTGLGVTTCVKNQSPQQLSVFKFQSDELSTNQESWKYEKANLFGNIMPRHTYCPLWPEDVKRLNSTERLRDPGAKMQR